MKKKVVLVGGCFDILHPGHITFLQNAKRAGDYLIVLLESDQKIKKLKGVNRPTFNQQERAKILEALKVVDKVIMLPFIESEAVYDRLVKKIKPDILATILKDPQIHHKKRAAKLVGAKLKYVTRRIDKFSTTKIIRNKDPER